MIRHIKSSEIPLDLHPADGGHVGKMENRWTHAHTNESLLIEFGYSEFKGEMWMPPATGFDLVAIVLSGTGSLDSDGVRYSFGPEDALIYEPPIGETRLMSDGFRYAYVTHWHSQKDLARYGWIAAGTPRSTLDASAE
jgi:hypothetical protein